MLTKKDQERLIAAACAVRKNAYAPYSNYLVGAALLAESGRIYQGCNYENAAFGAGVCAERVALGAALSNGERRIIAICVSGNDCSITPCGVCRQALSEFADGDTPVICCDDSGNTRDYTLAQLLPYSFTSDALQSP